MSDLNVRAAKALGWEPYDDQEVLFTVTIEVKEDNDFLRQSSYYDGELKFTTSYDWAMLGVAEIVKRGYEIQYLYHLMKQIYPSQITFKATPEQITQAWVEVLEDK